jgi:Swt1-like HEPN
MSRSKEAGDYLLAGLSPSEISVRMGISFNSVRQYLCILVGEGRIARADIAYSISERHLIDNAIRQAPRQNVHVILSKAGHKISRDVVDFYLIVRDPRPDLYALMGAIEVWLHRFVHETLQSTHGNAWWRDGIPEAIRISCQSRREADHTPLDDAFHYTNFIDLKTVIDKNWRTFVEHMPTGMGGKPETLERLQTANAIRNRIMHPIKDSLEYENDYRFLRKLESDLRS